jgi:glucose/arabinose dehydrogenase
MPVGDGSGRLAISDLRGELYLTDQDGDSVQLYLDHRAYDLSFDASMMPNETGLGGFAFHPEFSKKGKPGYGKFYTAFSAVSGSGEADYLKDDADSHESVIVEWTADDPHTVPFKGSHREVFRIGQFAPNHSVGTLAFNPTAKPGTSDYGNLYFCLGDGGAAFDPKNYGQSLASPHGAILRINPMPSRNAAYQIPEDNPFVSLSDVAPEIWAYGLRNPQHFSWDKDGRMFIGDIGQDHVEEVNIGVAGANYGWRLREGTFSTGSGVEGIYVGPLYDIPQDASPEFVDPVAQYDHDEGRAIASGFAYQGSGIKALIGKYVFADLVRGRIFYIDTQNLEPGNPTEIKELRIVFDGREQDIIDVVGYPNTYRNGPRADLRLGVDEDGELYLLTKGDGWVRKLVPVGAGS